MPQFCDQCGANVSSEARFCQQCGRGIGSSVVFQPVRVASIPQARTGGASAVTGVGVVVVMIGAIAIIGGFALHSHYNTLSSICGSGLGQVGQALSNGVQRQCSELAVWSDVGSALLIVGICGSGYGIRLATGGMLASSLFSTGSAKKDGTLQKVDIDVLLRRQSDSAQPSGWYPDPKGKASSRYWNGNEWTNHTSNE